MSVRKPRTIAVLTLALMLSACAGQQGTSSKSLPEVLNTARENADYRTAGVADCEAALDSRPNQIPYKSFFAGLFDVPEEQGGQAFCAALIEAAISGDFTRQEQAAFRKSAPERSKAPLGELLRDLLVAQERLMRQQAQGAAQSQACNCGQ